MHFSIYTIELKDERSLVANVITTRRKSVGIDQRKESADLLGVLVEESRLDDNDIRSILFDVVIAGSDTTASTATASLYVLHQPQHKKWLEKARQEAIDTNAGKGIPLNELRSKMPLIVGIAREILRLYPAVPFVGRTAVEEGSIYNGYPFAKGDASHHGSWVEIRYHGVMTRRNSIHSVG